MTDPDPPRRARPAETAILAATERLLATRRFSELAVNDIITAAGVSRTSFYARFGSRSAVLTACLRRVVAEIGVAVDPFLTATGEDPTTAIRVNLERWVTLAEQHGPLLRTVSEEWPHDPELREEWFSVMAAFADGTAEVITRSRRADGAGQADGAGHTGAGRAGPDSPAEQVDAQALATVLMWGYERVLHVSLVGGALGLDTPAAIVEPLAQMMLSGALGA